MIAKSLMPLQTLDPNHMVTTGEEGYRAYGPKTDAHQWLNNGKCCWGMS